MVTRIAIAMLFCLAAVSLTQAAVKLADFVTPCSLKDLKLDDCMTTQGRALLPHLVAGVREWDILPMDPLIVPKMQLQAGSGRTVDLSLDVTDSKNYGWKDIIINKIKIDPKTYDIEVDYKYPAYSIVGNYAVNGRILLLPIVGSGFVNITFVNHKVQFNVKSSIETRGGKNFLKVIDLKTLLTPDNVKFKLDNLFNNKELSDHMNTFLNSNALDVFTELKSNVEDVFSDILLTIVSRIFNKIPLNQLFTDVDS